MRIISYGCLFGLLSLISCYEVNEKTSEIFELSSCCNADSTWIKMYNSHKIQNLESKEVQEIIHEFKNMPFSTNILYFKDYPEEYIGISKGGTSIRYI